MIGGRTHVKNVGNSSISSGSCRRLLIPSPAYDFDMNIVVVDISNVASINVEATRHVIVFYNRLLDVLRSQKCWFDIRPDFSICRQLFTTPG